MAIACVALVVIGITAYVVLAGADFGAGFWDLTAGGPQRGGRIRGMIQHSMGPVWEANHVWLIFILVVLWTAFPLAFGSLMSTLSIPLFCAVIGIILRGSAFALRGEAATIKEARLLGGIFALSSVITPFFLAAAVGGIASGRVPVGNAAGNLVTSWLNPTSIMLGALAVATSAYLAAVFLAADSVRANVTDLVAAFRRRALLMAVIAGALAVGGVVTVKQDAPFLYHGLTSGDGISMLIVSIIAGVTTAGLVWIRRFAVARFTAAIAVAAIIVGWALAQSPYLLPKTLTLHQAAAPSGTLMALLIGLGVGAIVLVPALWLLYRLVLQGRLDQKFEPLDQRFRPLTAGDEGSVNE